MAPVTLALTIRAGAGQKVSIPTGYTGLGPMGRDTELLPGELGYLAACRVWIRS
jgi:hypothetical protein